MLWNKKQKEKLDMLRGSGVIYEEFLKQFPQKIFMKDRDSVYIVCNENYARDLKIKAEEIVGKTDYDFYLKELAEQYRADDKRIMDSGKIEEIEERYIQSGKERFVRTTKAPIKDGQGNITGILGIFYDITEQKKAKDLLTESEAKYKAIFNGAVEGIIAVDLETRQFHYANPSICRMFGYTEEEFLRLGVADIHPKESLDYVLGEFRAQAQNKKTLSSELPCLRKDGTLFYANVNAASIVIADNECVLGFFTDVTEHRRTEKEIQNKMQQLEIFNKAAVDRELKMIELKKEIDSLLRRLDEKTKYNSA